MGSNIARLGVEHSYPYFNPEVGGRMPEMSAFRSAPNFTFNEGAMSGVNKLKLLSYVTCALAVVVLLLVAFSPDMFRVGNAL